MLSSRAHAAAGLSALILITLVVPGIIPVAERAARRAAAAADVSAGARGPARARAVRQRPHPRSSALQPGYVVIGDSMAGTRVDERRLVELTGVQVAPLLQPGSGSAFWYLALKNWVIASGIRPRMVLIFFRDTNLTDVMFRLDEQFRWALDLAALEREDELNAVVARRLGLLHRARRLVDGLVGAEQARQRVEPAVTAWPVNAMLSSRRRQSEFMTRMNERLGLDHLRKMEAADMQIGEGPAFDFAQRRRRIGPAADAARRARAGLTLCFRARAAPADREPAAGAVAGAAPLRRRAASVRHRARRDLSRRHRRSRR